MYVYLRHGNLIKRFVDIELCDCVNPEVDGVSVAGTDPTVWFKVMILDSILVDCDGREVYWNKEPVVEATTIHWTREEDLEVEDVLPFYRGQGKMFEDGCHDFVVDIDELFEAGRSIVNELEHSFLDDIADSESLLIKQKVFRLLHVFILPKLTLRKTELKRIQEALVDIEQQQKDTEINIATKEKMKYRTGRFLEKQRIAMLISQDFASERIVSGFNSQFLVHFLKHIETDIDTGNAGMLEFENKISPLRTCQTIHEQDMLNYWRDQRDKMWSHINKALIARETIKNVTVRSRLNKGTGLCREASVHPDHIVYLETSCRLQSIEDEINELRHTLIKLASVKGATLQAIREIKENGTSFGKYENTTDSVLNRKAETEEWSTLSRKVDNLVSAKPLGFRDKHKKFCDKVITDMKKLTYGPKKHSSCTLEDVAKADMNGREKTNGSHSMSGNFTDQNVNICIEDICNEVIEHTLDMTGLLAEELYKRPRVEVPTCVFENIYICYESYVSGELMPVLYPLFEASYKQQCEAVTRCLSQVALSDNLIASIESVKSVSNRDSASRSSRTSANAANIESQKVLEMFEAFVKDEPEEKMSVFTNMRNIMEIVQYIVKQAKQMGHKSNPVCTDDILDVIIPLLQKLDPVTFLKLYAHINLLSNLRPPFVEGSRLQFALVSFSAAFQHLFNQHPSP